jgi:hypothetical protein
LNNDGFKPKRKYCGEYHILLKDIKQGIIYKSNGGGLFKTNGETVFRKYFEGWLIAEPNEIKNLRFQVYEIDNTHHSFKGYRVFDTEDKE